MGQALGLISPQERALGEMISLMSRQADVLETITDKESAEDAREPLKQIAIEVAELSIEMKSMEKPTDLSKEEMLALSKKFEAKMEKTIDRLAEQTKRIMKIPDAYAVLQDAENEARIAGSNITDDARTEKVRQQANDKGYSAVTSSTSLSAGMRVQVIDMSWWKNGTVRDVRGDGMVKVSLDSDSIHTEQNGSNPFDKYYRCSYLRIPDHPRPEPPRRGMGRRSSNPADPFNQRIPEFWESRVYVTVEKNIDQAIWDQWVLKMKANIDHSMLKGKREPRPVTVLYNGKLRSMFRPVSDIQKFADAIDFAKVVKVNKIMKTITIEPLDETK